MGLEEVGGVNAEIEDVLPGVIDADQSDAGDTLGAEAA